VTGLPDVGSGMDFSPSVGWWILESVKEEIGVARRFRDGIQNCSSCGSLLAAGTKNFRDECFITEEGLGMI